MERNMAMRSRGKGAISKLTRKLDEVFSRFIRLRDADQDGYVTCCTCGSRRHWKEVDCGHYVGRTARNTRWEEKNCHAQCKGCNCNEGKKPEYTLFLQRMYGPEIIEQLVIAGKRPRRFRPIELEALITHYQAELKRMEP